MIEEIILANLIDHEEFCRKTLPYIKSQYFQELKHKILFDLINNYTNKYNNLPTKEALFVDLDKLENISEQQFKDCSDLLSELKRNKNTQIEWLIENTEKFCKDKALYFAIHQAIIILDDKTEKTSKGIIPQLLSDALAVSFDTNIGHDYIEDADKRFEYYHEKQKRIKFDIELLNNITNGGIPAKTLNIVMGSIGVGKTLTLCHFAATNLMDALNVLYITMEMSEEEIGRRIDANLLDIPIQDIQITPKKIFDDKIIKIKSKGNGKLVIKEYPTANASSLTFKNLLNELKIKKNFIPDIIYVDYLNICASSRIKNRESLYQYIKSVSEELRGLANEFKIPLFTAIQLNRAGLLSSDPDMDDSADSIGIASTADMMIALISNDELEEANQYMCKQLKNRYTNKAINKRFLIGVDKSRMRLYDVENNEVNKKEVENTIKTSDIKKRFSDFV